MADSIPINEQVRILLKQMTPDEKIDQLVKIRGFDQYESDGTHITLSSHFREEASKHSFGTIYGILRADWWTKRDFSNGIIPSVAGEAVSTFQKAITDGKKLKIPHLRRFVKKHAQIPSLTRLFGKSKILSLMYSSSRNPYA